MGRIKKTSYYSREKQMSVESYLEYWPVEKYDPAFFFIRIPVGYQDIVETTEVQKIIKKWSKRSVYYIAAFGPTEQEAEKNFDKYMDLFFAAQTKEEKVLLFRHTSEKPDDRYYGGDRNLVLRFQYHSCQP